jgi:hypothetical protein
MKLRTQSHVTNLAVPVLCCALTVLSITEGTVFAWGWAARDAGRQPSENPTIYLGDSIKLQWDVNADSYNASYRKAGVGTNNATGSLDWQNISLVDDADDGGGDNDRGVESASFQGTSVATWYYSLWIGWGASVGDNGTYHNGSSTWHDGDGAGYISSFYTVSALTNPASILIATNTANPDSKIDLSWEKWNGKSVMVVRGTDETWVAPTNGDAYAQGSTALGGDIVVYNGGDTNCTDTNLTASTTYYYRFYTVNNDYYSGGTTVNESTASAPLPVLSVGPGVLSFAVGLGGTPSAQTFIVTNTGVAALIYTNAITYGADPGWLTLAPTNSSLAEDATQIHTATVSQATSVGVYTATNTLTGNQNNGAQMVTVTYTVTNLPNPTALSTSSIGTTNLTVNWTKASYDVMVVRRAGANPDLPANGTTYSDLETYGIDNRNQVIYAAGVGGSDVDVGLTSGTAYHYGFFSENSAYYSSGAFLAATTLVGQVDGIADEWTGAVPAVDNSSTIVDSEFIWKDKKYERRTDSGSDSDVDMHEFRMRADANDVYFMVRFDNITDVAYPYIAVSVDTDQDPDDMALNWIADDSDTGLGDGYYTNSNAAMHYPERNVIVHTVKAIGQRIELYEDDESSWKAPPTHGNQQTYFEKDSDEIIEFKIARADLDLAGVSTARLTVASYFNNTSLGDNQWANDGDTTADYTGTDALDTLSLLPYGVNDSAGDFGTAGEETSDNDLDSFFDVRFDADGIAANTLPTTPAATFPAEGATIESGPMSVMWSPSTDADDEVTSYFTEISTASNFGGGENQTVSYRGNSRHLDSMYPVSSTLADGTYYWRSRARDLSGALSAHVTNSFTVSGSDSDTTGPTATLLYIGPTYTEGASQTNITDKDFANTTDYVDIAVVWSDTSGVFLTNSAAYPNTNIVSAWGRVIPNWDLFRTNTETHATQDFGYDEPFTTFYGTNGATTVTTVFNNAFSITNALLDELFYLRVSAEDADDDRGHYPDPSHDGDPIPWDRSITTNSPILISITDDDTNAPIFTAVNVDGVDLFSTRMSGDLVITGLLQDAGSGVYGGSSNRYVLYRNDAQIAQGALTTAPGSDGAALASAEPIGVTIAEATATVPGAYRLDVMATDYDIERPGDSMTVTNTYYYTVITPAFDYRMKIYEPDYSNAATLTNFPVQVVFSTSLSGFSYAQFASPTGEDLRFCDENGDAWLDYTVKTWDTGGSSTNWVKIPTLTSNSVIWAYWGNSTGTNAPPATTNGAVWSDWSEGAATSSNFTFGTHAAVVAPGTYFELDGAAAASGVTLPYVEDFEDVAIGSLSGESHWVVQGSTRALNQTAKVYGGSRGASMEHAVASHGIEDATATDAWVNWFAWPTTCATNPVDPAELSTNTTAVFYLNPDGNVVALSNSTWVTFSSADLGTNNWIRFIVEMDYTADTWDLYAVTATTNARVALNLPFKYANRSAFTSFRTVEGGVTPLSYFDNLGIATNMPIGLDIDADELPDVWEETYMTNTSQTADGDLDNDGVSNLLEYYAGTDPSDSNNLMRVIGLDLDGAASANVRLQLRGGAAIAPTNFFGVGDNVQRSFKVFAASNATDTKTLVATIDSDGSGTNTWTDTGMTDTYSRRFYEISVVHTAGGYTNTEEWAVHVQPRAASKSYMICAPVNYEGTNNNLNALLGDHLARGLHADTTQGDSDRIEWIATDGSWARYWLSTTGWKIWGTTTAADVTITPGQGMWVVRGSGSATRSNAVFAGKSFTDADVQQFSFSKDDAGLSQDGWTIFGWPLPEPLEARAADTSQNQLGFFSGGGVGGEHQDHTNALAGDQIWIWNNGWSAYWLVDDQDASSAADGRWFKGHGTSGDDFADITLEPGGAYYYFHSSNWGASDFTWTPTNAP